MIPGVFALSHGSLANPIPMDSFQMHEILLTAAQSALAVVLLARLRLSLSGAFLLFALFAGQLVTRAVAESFPRIALGISKEQIHVFFSMLYLTAAAALFLQHPQWLLRLWRGRIVDGPQTPVAASPLANPVTLPNLNLSEDSPLFLKTPRCANCQWRLAAAKREDPSSD